MNHWNPSEKCLKWKENLRIIEHQYEELRRLTKSASWSNPQAQEEQCQRIGLLQGTCLKRGEKTKIKKQNIEITKKA